MCNQYTYPSKGVVKLKVEKFTLRVAKNTCIFHQGIGIEDIKQNHIHSARFGATLPNLKTANISNYIRYVVNVHVLTRKLEGHFQVSISPLVSGKSWIGRKLTACI